MNLNFAVWQRPERANYIIITKYVWNWADLVQNKLDFTQRSGYMTPGDE